MVAFNICGPTTLYWLYRHLMDLSPAYISQPIRTVHHWHCGKMTGMADKPVHYSPAPPTIKDQIIEFGGDWQAQDATSAPGR